MPEPFKTNREYMESVDWVVIQPSDAATSINIRDNFGKEVGFVSRLNLTIDVSNTYTAEMLMFETNITEIQVEGGVDTRHRIVMEVDISNPGAHQVPKTFLVTKPFRFTGIIDPAIHNGVMVGGHHPLGVDGWGY